MSKAVLDCPEVEFQSNAQVSLVGQEGCTATRSYTGGDRRNEILREHIRDNEREAAIKPKVSEMIIKVCCSMLLCLVSTHDQLQIEAGTTVMSRGRATSGSQYQCFGQSHFASAPSFQGVLFSA